MSDENMQEKEEKSRKLSSRGLVVNYADAHEELKAQMETILEPLTIDPTNFDLIIEYASEPLKELGKVSQELIHVQANFMEQTAVLNDAVANIAKAARKFDPAKLANAAKSVASYTVNGAVKTGNALARGFKAMVDAATGAGKKKTEDEKLVESMASDLPRMFGEMLKLVQDAVETEKAVLDVMAATDRLTAARIKALVDLNVYLGAAPEMQRRYREELIPEEQALVDETAGDLEAKARLNEMIDSANRFNEHITRVESSRVQAALQAEQLATMKGMMKDQRAKLRYLVVNGQQEWMALLAAAGLAGSALKVQQNILEMDKFGDNAVEQTAKMMEETMKMMIQSRARGTVDHNKLIEVSGRLEKMVEESEKAARDSARKLEEVKGKLRTLGDSILEGAEKRKSQRILEASEGPAPSPAARKTAAPAPAPAANDDQDQAPTQAAPEAPAAKAADGSTKSRRGGPSQNL